MTNNKELGRGTATFEHAQSFKSLSYKRAETYFSEGSLTSPFKTSTFLFLCSVHTGFTISQSQPDLQMLKKNSETLDLRAFHFKLFIIQKIRKIKRNWSMKYIVCINQKSVLFILLLNSKTHSSGDTKSWETAQWEELADQAQGECAGERECTAGHCHCAFEASSWGLALTRMSSSYV